MVLSIKAWRKPWKSLRSFSSASIITTITVNFVKKVAFNRSHLSRLCFAIAEALYTDKIRVNFIPCLLEAEYQPQGWLGIIIRDQLYIDFSAPDNFDRAFEELIAEIQAIDQRSPNPSSKSNFSFSSFLIIALDSSTCLFTFDDECYFGYQCE